MAQLPLKLKAAFKSTGSTPLGSVILEKIDAIEDTDMESIKNDTYEGAQQAHKDGIERELKRFFVLVLLSRQTGLPEPVPINQIAPSLDVDRLWHAFLDEPGYDQFCIDHVGGAVPHATHHDDPNAPVRDHATMLGHLETYFDEVDPRVWSPLAGCNPF